MEELGENGPSCEIHFIRCIKPNEQTSPDKFVDSLVLQQIGYMGVLDSIKVRKMNYPNRVKYERFYERYEDLCSVSDSTPIKVLRERKADFMGLTKKVMEEQLAELGKDLYAFGKTKIFMKNEIVAVLEEARMRAQVHKERAAVFIQDAFLASQARAKHKARITKVIRAQSLYRKHLAFKQGFSALSFALKVENALAEYKTEKRRAVEEVATRKLSSVFLTTSLKSIIKRGITARHTLLTNLLRISGIHKVRKVVLAISLTHKIFSAAWNLIRRQRIERVARTLARISKGYLARRKFAKTISRAKEIGYF